MTRRKTPKGFSSSKIELAQVCFLEKVLRDRRNGRLGDIPIPYAELEQLVCAELRTAVPLKLIDLRRDRLLQMGVPTDAVRASSHALGRNWSLAFWSHQEQPDGIIHPSRLNQETNLALYDRSLAKIKLSAVRLFLEYRADVAALIREFRLAIV